MNKRLLSPDSIHKPTTYYSHAAVVGGVVYLAGQAPHDTSGSVWDPSDPEGQVKRVFENMGEVLKAAGVNFKDIVCLKVFLRRSDLMETLWEVSEEYLDGHHPAVTVAVVDGLADPDYLLEFDAIAIRNEPIDE